MALTLLFVVVQFALLSLFGLAALAPLKPKTRNKLLPAAPIFGAALIAVLANWACRWLPITHAVFIFVAVAVLLVVHGVRRGRRPFAIPRQAWTSMALAVAACTGGFVLAGAPAVVAASSSTDTGLVAPAYIIDGFYFGGVSTYMVDDPLVPGPAMTDSWKDDDPPATTPALDTNANRLRFGQSAVSATMSVLVWSTPYQTVYALSLVWLLLLGLAAFTVGTLWGLRRRGALLAALLVTSSGHVVAQPLQGQNDGLLGASLFLMALALSSVVLAKTAYTWPLILIGAGLAATYSEYFILLVPAVAVLGLVGPRATLLHRLNLLGGRWAATVVLVPWAWVWLAQTFKITSRTTNGPSPFAGRSGWELLRAYIGAASPPGNTAYGVVLDVIAVLVVVAASVGWAAALILLNSRGALLALLVVITGLELYAVNNVVGNLQYRVVQLGFPVLIVFAVLGWDALLRRPRTKAAAPPAGEPVREPGRDSPIQPRARRRVVLVIGAVTCAGFVLSNLVTVGLTTSYARAETQHVPGSFVDHVRDLVRDVGPDNVTVVTPQLTDLAAMSMALDDYPEVDYPAVVSANVYVGTRPHWDREPDPYYVVGPGASVIGDVTYVVRDGDYAIVRLHRSGMIVAPFQGGWTRTTFMRGFPCARQNVTVVVIRGGASTAQNVRFATRARVPSRNSGIALFDESGVRLRSGAGPQRTDGWTIQTFRVPRASSAILGVRFRESLAAQVGAGVPLRFGADDGSPLELASVDADLTSACIDDFDSGMDGYDRELTLMRAAP